MVILGTVEVGLGWWLVSDIVTRQRAWMMASLFGCFVLINIYQVWNHDRSCACFGAWKVPPMVTLGIDSLIGTGWLVLPRGRTLLELRGFVAKGLVMGTLVAVLFGCPAWGGRFRPVADDWDSDRSVRTGRGLNSDMGPTADTNERTGSRKTNELRQALSVIAEVWISDGWVLSAIVTVKA
jgi:hypothetical protein